MVLVTGLYRGKKLDQRHRIVEDGACYRVEQEIDGNWRPTPGQWLKTTLADMVAGQELSIDYNQQWSIIWP